MRPRLALTLLLPACLLAAWSLLPAAPAPVLAETPTALERLITTLEPLALPLPEPGPSDWLANYPEAGQSYAAWQRADPVVATPDRRTLVVQPMGSFEPAQRQVMTLSAEWLGLFFGLPCRVEDDLPSDAIPDRARRRNPHTGLPQVHAPTLLYDLLLPRLPDDAIALIGFTGEDLYPEPSWNFVFGMALLRQRTGVWSMHRFGDPGGGPLNFRETLQRTMKLATHETGHNLTMQHCTAHACNMNGSNNLPETDRSPAWLCPQCLAKLLHATGADPIDRFEALLAFASRHDLTEEIAYYRLALRALREDEPEGPQPLGPAL
jgi:archaemetzincin